MKPIFITIVAAALVTLLAACSKSSGENLVSTRSDIAGGYSGKFTRTGVPDTGYLMIDFHLNTYDGSSRDPGFPGICGGRYTLNGSTIVFDDTCYSGPATAMLEGTFNFQKQSDGDLRIWRSEGSVTDEYLLHRLFR